MSRKLHQCSRIRHDQSRRIAAFNPDSNVARIRTSVLTAIGRPERACVSMTVSNMPCTSTTLNLSNGIRAKDGRMYNRR